MNYDLENRSDEVTQYDPAQKKLDFMTEESPRTVEAKKKSRLGK